MRIAMIAPPWLSIPPQGYGGIEAMLSGLVDGLVAQGDEVEIFAAGDIRLEGCTIHKLYEEEQYRSIHLPMYESPLPISVAHLQYALKIIAEDGGFDIIHDHNGFIGPFVLDWATKLPNMPPALHTYHGPPFPSGDRASEKLSDSTLMWDQFQPQGRSYVVGISNALVKDAPRGLKNILLDSVYNAIDVDQYKYSETKKDFFITLARFSPDKGQHIAVRHCLEQGQKLKMAGTCASIASAEELLLELLNPDSKYRRNADFRYYSDQILPATILNKSIKFMGNVSGEKKKDLLADAKALLFPIDWEEPFGMSVIEALASGTPVVAMNKGAMSEIVEHGVTGFLANNDAEFGEYMKHVDDIDPAACRKAVEAKFSVATMAESYRDRYEEIVRRDKES